MNTLNNAESTPKHMSIFTPKKEKNGQKDIGQK